MTPLYSLSCYFGGTFDPIHNGHINLATGLIDELALSRLTLLPCHIPPHKAVPGISSQMRLDMVSLACQQYTKLQVDARELASDAPSFTVNTLAALKHQQPNSSLCFVIGMDSFNQFHLWREWQRILTLCHLVVCPRPGYSAKPASEVAGYLSTHRAPHPSALSQQQTGLIYFAHTALYDVASSQLRHTPELMQRHVPNLVWHYIEQHQLYFAKP